MGTVKRMKELSRFQNRLLEEVRDLPEDEQERVLQVVRLLKAELKVRSAASREPDEPCSVEEQEKKEILRHAGLLADLGVEEQDLFDGATCRPPLFGHRPVKL